MNLRIQEKLDVKPLRGEYILFTDGTVGGFNSSPCFICGSDPQGRDVEEAEAWIQCGAAGQRLMAMFKHGLRLESEPNARGYAVVKITACLKHNLHLRLLREQTADGIITQEMVARLQQSLIGPKRFDQFVREKAQEFYLRNRKPNKENDRSDAFSRLEQELGRLPSLNQIQVRADQLSEQRKQPRALDDWLRAESFYVQIFVVTPDDLAWPALTF